MASEQPVPGYNVVHIIGQGGQAQVFLAEREHDGLRVALKVLDRALRQDPVFLQRFVREYKLLASVESPYVARIYDQGFSGDHLHRDGVPALGHPRARIREGLTTRSALRIAGQIAQALSAIHARGIVHRDLKPANILPRRRPPGARRFRPRARHEGELDADRGRAVSRHAALHEPRAVPRAADRRAVRSLQPGRRALRDDHRQENLRRRELRRGHRHARKRPPPKLADLLSVHQPLLDRLLAKEPANRFQSAAEVVAEIGVRHAG